MSENRTGMRVGVFNAKGLQKKLEIGDDLSKGIQILGTCETWVKSKDDAIRDLIDEFVHAPPAS